MKKSKKNPNSLVFLFPFKFIKEKQLSKKDVKTIKDNLVNSFANVYLIMSIIIIALLTGLSRSEERRVGKEC